MLDAVADQVELVYDRLIAEEKLKAGTKYERLAAIVFRILTEETTIHDMRLRGAVGVPHQIDVVVGDDERRILIEAKDYEKRVDLPVVRDFSAVVDDLKPDEAFVVTTVGFSKNAIKWAEAKGLTLAILRPPGDDDWAGLVKRVRFEIRASAPHDPSVEWFIEPSEASRFEDGTTPMGLCSTDELKLRDEAGRLWPLRDLLEPQIAKQYRSVEPGTEAELSGEHRFEEATWLCLPDQEPFRVTGYVWRQKIGVATEIFTVGDGVGGLAAELVLRTLDGSIHRMFSNRQIQSWVFDGKEVVPRVE